MDLTVHVKFNQNIAQHVKTPAGETQVKLLRNLNNSNAKEANAFLKKQIKFSQKGHIFIEMDLLFSKQGM